MTKNNRLTMGDLITRPSSATVYRIVQNGIIEYEGTDWVRVGRMMSWLRSYRWAEVLFYKNDKLTETLEEPKVEEPEPPKERSKPEVTAAMVRAAVTELSNSAHPYMTCVKRAIEAALDAQEEED